MLPSRCDGCDEPRHLLAPCEVQMGGDPAWIPTNYCIDCVETALLSALGHARVSFNGQSDTLGVRQNTFLFADETSDFKGSLVLPAAWPRNRWLRRAVDHGHAWNARHTVPLALAALLLTAACRAPQAPAVPECSPPLEYSPAAGWCAVRGSDAWYEGPGNVADHVLRGGEP